MNPVRVRTAVIVAAVLVAGLVGLAQQRSAPTPAAGEISGVLVSAGASPVPIRRAVVSLASDVLPYARSVITDDAGRFVFASLPELRDFSKEGRVPGRGIRLGGPWPRNSARRSLAVRDRGSRWPAANAAP